MSTTQHIPIWRLPFAGKRWSDMPGHDVEEQRLHFALFRRGLFEVDDSPEAMRVGKQARRAWESVQRRRFARMQMQQAELQRDREWRYAPKAS